MLTLTFPLQKDMFMWLWSHFFAKMNGEKLVPSSFTILLLGSFPLLQKTIVLDFFNVIKIHPLYGLQKGKNHLSLLLYIIQYINMRL